MGLGCYRPGQGCSLASAARDDHSSSEVNSASLRALGSWRWASEAACWTGSTLATESPTSCLGFPSRLLIVLADRVDIFFLLSHGQHGVVVAGEDAVDVVSHGKQHNVDGPLVRRVGEVLSLQLSFRQPGIQLFEEVSSHLILQNVRRLDSQPHQVKSLFHTGITCSSLVQEGIVLKERVWH